MEVIRNIFNRLNKLLVFVNFNDELFEKIYINNLHKITNPDFTKIFARNVVNVIKDNYVVALFKLIETDRNIDNYFKTKGIIINRLGFPDKVKVLSDYLFELIINEFKNNKIILSESDLHKGIEIVDPNLISNLIKQNNIEKLNYELDKYSNFSDRTLFIKGLSKVLNSKYESKFDILLKYKNQIKYQEFTDLVEKLFANIYIQLTNNNITIEEIKNDIDYLVFFMELFQTNVPPEKSSFLKLQLSGKFNADDKYISDLLDSNDQKLLDFLSITVLKEKPLYYELYSFIIEQILKLSEVGFDFEMVLSVLSKIVENDKISYAMILDIIISYIKSKDGKLKTEVIFKLLQSMNNVALSKQNDVSLLILCHIDYLSKEALSLDISNLKKTSKLIMYFQLLFSLCCNVIMFTESSEFKKNIDYLTGNKLGKIAMAYCKLNYDLYLPVTEFDNSIKKEDSLKDVMIEFLHKVKSPESEFFPPLNITQPKVKTLLTKDLIKDFPRSPVNKFVREKSSSPKYYVNDDFSDMYSS